MTYNISIKSAIEDGNGCLIRHISRRYEIRGRGINEVRRRANHAFYKETGKPIITRHEGYFLITQQDYD